MEIERFCEQQVTRILQSFYKTKEYSAEELRKRWRYVRLGSELQRREYWGRTIDMEIKR